jgi:hypothetical protein
MGTKISIDEVLAELEMVAGGKADGESMEELVERTGRSSMWLSKNILRPMKRANRLVVGRRMGESVSGTRRVVPTYKILPSPGGKEKGGKRR